jgi:hypothetical protein
LLLERIPANGSRKIWKQVEDQVSTRARRALSPLALVPLSEIARMRPDEVWADNKLNGCGPSTMRELLAVLKREGFNPGWNLERDSIMG